MFKNITLRTITQTFTVLLLWVSSLALAVDVPMPQPPEFNARSYVLMDYHSGQVIAEKAIDEQIEPASLTKLMTAYITFAELSKGNIRADDQVLVSEKAWRAPGSRMFIEVGSRVSVEELLRGVIIQSGNDASIALAEHIAGDERMFATWMNQYAANLGMSQSNFTNATGLPNPELRSSSRDLAILARAIITDFPAFYPLYKERVYTYNEITQYNRNKLLWRDDSVDGIKTGHTESAGFCLVASAERDGMRLISVVVGTDSENARARASQSLLNYGFRFFETHQLMSSGDSLTQARVWKGEATELDIGPLDPVYITIGRGRRDAVTITTSVTDPIIAPVEKHQLLGSARVEVDGNSIREVPIYATREVPTGGLWQRMTDEVRLFLAR